MRLRMIAALSLLATPALAHTGMGFHLHGWDDGMMHPLTGADHIAAMITVGLWAAFLGGRALWALPLAFIAAMACGAALGSAGVVFPALEVLIAASVIALGAVLAFGLSVPVTLGAALCGAFALAHGMAHGAEMPANAAGLAYDEVLPGDVLEASEHLTWDVITEAGGRLLFQRCLGNGINVASRKLSPTEIAARIREASGIHEVTISGVPSRDPERTQDVVCAIKLPQEQLTQAFKSSACAALAPWEVPRKWVSIFQPDP